MELTLPRKKYGFNWIEKTAREGGFRYITKPAIAGALSGSPKVELSLPKQTPTINGFCVSDGCTLSLYIKKYPVLYGRAENVGEEYISKP